MATTRKDELHHMVMQAGKHLNLAYQHLFEEICHI
jgi:hypothetical protein